MIEVVPFKPEHITDIGVTVSKLLGVQMTILMNAPGPKWAALKDGRAIGAGGVARMGTSWVAWVNPTPELIQHPIAFTKLALKLLKDFQANYSWDEIEALCAVDNDIHRKWAEWFGFKARDARGDMQRMILERGELQSQTSALV